MFITLSRGLDLALLLVVAAIAALLLTGGYAVELGELRLSSHRLGPLLWWLLPLTLLRLWLALGWRDFLLLLVSSLVALGLAEAAVRWLDPPLAKPNMVQIHRPSAEFDWELIPGSGGVGVLGETIRINTAGFRDQEHRLDKPTDTYRIAVIGDSFTFGMGVDLAETYHRVLARQLEEAHPAVEVLGFGVAGYQLWQHLALLRRRVLDYSPDVVVLALFLDDIEKPRPPYHDPDWQPHNPFASLLPALEHPSRLWTLLGNLHRLLEVRYRYRRGADYLRGIEARKHAVDDFYRQVQTGTLPPVAYRDFARGLGEFAALARGAGTRPLLAYIPDASQLHEPTRQHINRLIAGVAADLAVGFVDFTPVFEAVADPGKLYLFPLDAHTSAAGHRLMAEALARALETGGLLPDS